MGTRLPLGMRRKSSDCCDGESTRSVRTGRPPSDVPAKTDAGCDCSALCSRRAAPAGSDTPPSGSATCASTRVPSLPPCSKRRPMKPLLEAKVEDSMVVEVTERMMTYSSRTEA